MSKLQHHGVYLPRFTVEEIPTVSKAELEATLQQIIVQHARYRQNANIHKLSYDAIGRYEKAAAFIAPISDYLKANFE